MIYNSNYRDFFTFHNSKQSLEIRDPRLSIKSLTEEEIAPSLEKSMSSFAKFTKPIQTIVVQFTPKHHTDQLNQGSEGNGNCSHLSNMFESLWTFGNNLYHSFHAILLPQGYNLSHSVICVNEAICIHSAADN